MYCPVCSEHIKEAFERYKVKVLFLHDLSKYKGNEWRKCSFCDKKANYVASGINEDED